MKFELISDFNVAQRTDVVDDESWVMGFLDIIDPTIDRLKRIFNLDQNSFIKASDSSKSVTGTDDNSSGEEPDMNGSRLDTASGFNLDKFIRENLSLEPSKLEGQFGWCLRQDPKNIRPPGQVWKKRERTSQKSPKL